MTDGRVALVTGGCGTVGAAMGRRLVEEGWAVALLDRDEERLRATAAELDGVGRAIPIPCDLLDPAAVGGAVDAIVDELGPIDILVNNAGIIGPIEPVHAADLDAWNLTMRINYEAPLRLCRLLLPGMLERGFGRIVNVSSRAVLDTPGPHVAYNVSKMALTRLTAHLAVEVEGRGVTANAICPGGVRSGMWAEIRDVVRGARAGTVDDLASYVDGVEAGGSSPDDAARLVLRIIRDDVNGGFLFYEPGPDGFQQVVRPLA